MRHRWGVLVEMGYTGGGIIGERPEPYWVTDENVCARCGLTRRQARRKPCEEPQRREALERLGRAVAS